MIWQINKVFICFSYFVSYAVQLLNKVYEKGSHIRGEGAGGWGDKKKQGKTATPCNWIMHVFLSMSDLWGGFKSQRDKKYLNIYSQYLRFTVSTKILTIVT